MMGVVFVVVVGQGGQGRGNGCPAYQYGFRTKEISPRSETLSSMGRVGPKMISTVLARKWYHSKTSTPIRHTHQPAISRYLACGRACKVRNSQAKGEGRIGEERKIKRKRACVGGGWGGGGGSGVGGVLDSVQGWNKFGAGRLRLVTGARPRASGCPEREKKEK